MCYGVVSIFRARRKRRRAKRKGAREGVARVYEHGSRILPRKSASRRVVRAIRENSLAPRACGCTGAYPHCYGYISACLSCEKELGSSPYVRKTIAMPRLFYSFLASTDSRGTPKISATAPIYILKSRRRDLFQRSSQWFWTLAKSVRYRAF